VLLLVHILFMNTQMLLSKFFEQTIFFHLDKIMHEIIDVIDIGPQPIASECPDLINQDECSVSTNGDESSHSIDWFAERGLRKVPISNFS